MPSKRVDFKYLRANASFETVAAHYNLKLEGKGDQRSALCCFHDEDTPSLKIHLGKKIFHCFGCDAKGNVLDFVTLKEGGKPDNPKQLREGAFKLAEICGIDASGTAKRGESESKPAPAKVTAPKPEPKLPTAKPAPLPNPSRGNKPLSFELKLDPQHAYLAERVSKEAIETFGLGFCSRGIMKGRIAIPIHNEKGELIAYAGRWAEEELPKGTPKYLLPDGFEKQSVVFNLHRLPKGAKEVVMVESYFSVFRLHELGTPVVSPMGHSVSEDQCKLLAACGVERVLVLFDGDEAGEQGIAESVPLLSRYFYVHSPKVSETFKPHSASDDQLAQIVRQ
jgi:DNA primase